ncbi:MAG: hypothetical protein M3137_01000 [Actinomycetota bacterium]|nr:hypothetical protein [Actinomycetota bacterium]
MIDGQLDACGDQYRSLLEAEVRPYRLDDATVARVKRVYGDTASDLWLYDTQLARWADENPTREERQELERLGRRMMDLHEVVDSVLALVSRLENHTIEASSPRATSRSAWNGSSEVVRSEIRLGVASG